MKFTQILLFLFISVTLVLSVFFSFKSLTGYLVSDIADSSGNLVSFVFLMLGIVGTFIYIKTFRNRQTI